MNEQQTKPCQCGKKMILRKTGMCLTTYPAQYPTYWFCAGCGTREEGPTLRDKTDLEIETEAWEEANRP